jgi:hypothetical protein
VYELQCLLGQLVALGSSGRQIRRRVCGWSNSAATLGDAGNERCCHLSTHTHTKHSTLNRRQTTTQKHSTTQTHTDRQGVRDDGDAS